MISWTDQRHSADEAQRTANDGSLSDESVGTVWYLKSRLDPCMDHTSFCSSFTLLLHYAGMNADCSAGVGAEGGARWVAL